MKQYLKAALDKTSPKLLRSLRAMRDQWYLSSLVPQNSVYGFKIISVGEQSRMVTGDYEPEETELIKQILSKSKLFINIGANVGFYALHAAKLGVPSIAFEPVPINQRLLLRNIAENSYENLIQVYPFALSSKPGISKIYGSFAGASLTKGWARISHHFYDLVPTNTIDNLFPQNFNLQDTLILMDVEGHELPVLEGAKHFLESTTNAKWVIEICFRESQPEGVDYNPNALKTFNLFWERGYNCYEITTSLRRVEKSEIESNLFGKSMSIKTRNFFFSKE